MHGQHGASLMNWHLERWLGRLPKVKAVPVLLAATVLLLCN